MRRLAAVENARPLALQAYQQLPKAVLVHCSAGMTRSPRVARHIGLWLERQAAQTGRSISTSEPTS